VKIIYMLGTRKGLLIVLV